MAWGKTAVQALLGSSVGGRSSAHRQLGIGPGDLRLRERRRKLSVCVLFAVDASESMGAGRRLAVVKGSVLALLRRAYQRRHTVAVVAFGGERARLLLRPTAGVSVARRALMNLRPQGATPMASGVKRSLEVLHQVQARGMAESTVVIFISDGGANIPLQPGGDPRADVLRLLPRLRDFAGQTMWVDTKGSGRTGETEMRRYARLAGGRYYGPAWLSPAAVLSAVSRAESENPGG